MISNQIPRLDSCLKNYFFSIRMLAQLRRKDRRKKELKLKVRNIDTFVQDNIIHCLKLQRW